MTSKVKSRSKNTGVRVLSAALLLPLPPHCTPTRAARRDTGYVAVNYKSVVLKCSPGPTGGSDPREAFHRAISSKPFLY